MPDLSQPAPHQPPAAPAADWLALLPGDTLIAALPLGIAVIDQDLRYCLVNQALSSLSGQLPSDYLGRTIGEMLPAIAPLVEPILRHVLARGEAVAEHLVSFPAPSGEAAAAHAWLMSFQPLRAADGRTAGVQVVISDVTARRRDAAALADHAEALSSANAELTRALRLKDEFLAMMSHELRTPLNAVLGLTEALAEEVYGPISAAQRHALAQVAESGRHLLGVLSDILDLTKIGAGTITLEPDVVGVDEVCRSALQRVRAQAVTKQIRLVRAVDDGAEALRADERRLTQILTNLLDNAVKFTPEGGSVGLEVAADAAAEQIRFTVWDTGIGIAEADMDRLFQPFTQVDGRLARSYEGIGLGLTLVRRLTELHGGSVAVTSTPGAGSRFTIALPWSEAANRGRAPAPAPLPAISWPSPPLVVVADDDPITLELLNRCLQQAGCQVSKARNGAEALAAIRAQRPDLAILDIQMPELDGLSVIRQVRADPAVAATPVIAVTALAMPGDRERCLAAGANHYLAKPVNLRGLLSTVSAVLGSGLGGGRA